MNKNLCLLVALIIMALSLGSISASALNIAPMYLLYQQSAFASTTARLTAASEFASVSAFPRLHASSFNAAARHSCPLFVTSVVLCVEARRAICGQTRPSLQGEGFVSELFVHDTPVPSRPSGVASLRAEVGLRRRTGARLYLIAIC